MTLTTDSAHGYEFYLDKDSEYRLEYPIEYFNNKSWTRTEDGVTTSGDSIRSVSFNIRNNIAKGNNITYLDMSVLPLFPLD